MGKRGAGTAPLFSWFGMVRSRRANRLANPDCIARLGELVEGNVNEVNDLVDICIGRYMEVGDGQLFAIGQRTEDAHLVRAAFDQEVETSVDIEPYQLHKAPFAGRMVDGAASPRRSEFRDYEPRTARIARQTSSVEDIKKTADESGSEW